MGNPRQIPRQTPEGRTNPSRADESESSKLPGSAGRPRSVSRKRPLQICIRSSTAITSRPDRFPSTCGIPKQAAWGVALLCGGGPFISAGEQGRVSRGPLAPASTRSCGNRHRPPPSFPLLPDWPTDAERFRFPHQSTNVLSLASLFDELMALETKPATHPGFVSCSRSAKSFKRPLACLLASKTQPQLRLDRLGSRGSRR